MNWVLAEISEADHVHANVGVAGDVGDVGRSFRGAASNVCSTVYTQAAVQID